MKIKRKRKIKKKKKKKKRNMFQMASDITVSSLKHNS